MPTTNKEIVEKVNAAFAEEGLEGFLSFCADDVEWTIVGEKSVQGKEAIRTWIGSMGTGAPKFIVDQVIAEGDSVVAHGSMTMTEKDGSSVPYAYCDIYRFRDARIIRMISFVIKTEG
jgi:ketosteroid isomerase-like protein